MQTGTQKITPFLWFDDQAEEAVDFVPVGGAGIYSIERQAKITLEAKLEE